MPNDNFFSYLLQKAYEVKNNPKSSSWFSKAELRGATAVFIKALEAASVSWETVPKLKTNTLENRNAIIFALFKFCISHDKNESDAFKSITDEWFGLKKTSCPDAYKIEKDRAPFLETLTQLFGKTHLIIDDPSAFIYNIYNLMLRLDFCDSECSQMIASNGMHFIAYLHPHIEIGADSAILENKLFKEILAKNLEIGQALMRHLSERATKSITAESNFNTNFNNLIINWLQLLKLNAIKNDATLVQQNFSKNLLYDGKVFNFMTCWQLFNTESFNGSYIPSNAVISNINASVLAATTALPSPFYNMMGSSSQSYYAAYAISVLIHRDLLKDLSRETRGEILSLPCNYGNQTPLQVLADNYDFGYKTLIKQHIMKLLSEEVSIKNETPPYWIETLHNKFDDSDEWQKILEALPAHMLKELHDKEVYLELAKTLTPHLKKIDFWTLSLDKKLAPKRIMMSQTIQKIAGSESLQAEQKRIARFNENIKKLKEKIKQKTATNASDSLFDPAKSALAPIIVERYSQLSHLTRNQHEKYYKQQLEVFERNLVKDENEYFVITHHITNEVYYQVNMAVNSNNNMQELIIRKSDFFVMPDEYKDEINISIQKSLALLAEDFHLSGNPKQMIKRWITAYQNINTVLDTYHLTFQEIVLSNPESKSILMTICVNILLFDDEQALKETSLYQMLNAELTPIINLKSNKIHQDTQDYAADLIAQAKLYKKSNSYSKPLNQINQKCVDQILSLETFDLAQEAVTSGELKMKSMGQEETGHSSSDHSQQAMFLSLKLFLIIIDYRIVSFTENIYKKGFYRNYLMSDVLKKYPTSAMKNDFKIYKPYIISQINISLKKLAFEHYETSSHRNALENYIFPLMADFDIKPSELDDYAQNIFTDFYCLKEVSGTLGKKPWVQELIKDYYIHQKAPSIEDAKEIMRILGVSHRNLSQFDLYCIRAVAAINDASYRPMEEYLRLLSTTHGDYSAKFYNKFLTLLSKGLISDIKWRDKSICAYINIGVLSNTLQTCLGDSAEDLKTQVTSMAYASRSEINLPQPQFDDHEIDVEMISNMGKPIYLATTSDPAPWCQFYETRQIPKETFTPLQHLAILFLTTPEDGLKILADIESILKYKPNISNENTLHGYWIEILLAGMHQQSTNVKEYFIGHILPIIPDDVMHAILQKDKRNKIVATLFEQIDLFTMSKAVGLSYQLYLLLFLHAIVRNKDKIQNMELFIENICKLLLFFNCKEGICYQYLAEQYKDFPQYLKEIFSEKMKKISGTDPLIIKSIITALYKMMEISDSYAQYAYLGLIQTTCIAAENVLYVPASYFDKYDIKVKENVSHLNTNVNLSPEAKSTITQSIKKSLNLSFKHHSSKWLSFEYMVGVLKFLNQLCEKCGLKLNDLLPDDSHVLSEHYTWLSLYKRKDAELALLDELCPKVVYGILSGHRLVIC